MLEIEFLYLSYCNEAIQATRLIVKTHIGVTYSLGNGEGEIFMYFIEKKGNFSLWQFFFAKVKKKLFCGRKENYLEGQKPAYHSQVTRNPFLEIIDI